MDITKQVETVKAFLELFYSDNPPTAAEIRALIAKRPARYECLRPYIEVAEQREAK